MPRRPWKLSEHPLPGLTVFSFLSVFQLTYLPPPWGECRSSEMGLDFFPVYSITACRIDCETRYIVENCNCRMVHMPGGWQGPRTSAVSHPDRKHLTPIVLGGLWYLTAKRQIDKLHPSIHQGSILICRGAHMCASPPSPCSICFPVVCSSCLLSSTSR